MCGWREGETWRHTRSSLSLSLALAESLATVESVFLSEGSTWVNDKTGRKRREEKQKQEKEERRTQDKTLEPPPQSEVHQSWQLEKLSMYSVQSFLFERAILTVQRKTVRQLVCKQERKVVKGLSGLFIEWLHIRFRRTCPFFWCLS